MSPSVYVIIGHESEKYQELDVTCNTYSQTDM